MPQTREIQVYDYDELSTTAKARALDWFRDRYLDDDWSDVMLDDATMVLSHLGLEPVSGRGKLGFQFALGEALVFDANWVAHQVTIPGLVGYIPEASNKREDDVVDISAVCVELSAIALKFPEGTGQIRISGRSIMSKHMTFEFETNIVAGDTLEHDAAEQRMSELWQDVCIWVHKKLEREYEYVTSESELEGGIRHLGIEWHKDGKMFAIPPHA
jgi:hypothetical protein